MDPFKTDGAFSWCELTTSDPAAAATFYQALFGWTVKDMGAEMGGYRTLHVGADGAGIGGITGQQPGAPAMPPHWGCYVTVDNVEATVDKCSSLGGKTLVPPMDIPGVGRMSVLQDPQGAVLSVIAYSMPS